MPRPLARLAMRAVEGRPLPDARLLHPLPANPALRARAAIDEILELERTRRAVGSDVIAQRAAALGDRGPEDVTNRVDQPCEPGLRQPIGRCRWPYRRGEQRLVRVDVAYPRDDAIVHQYDLDRRSPVTRRTPQVVRVERRLERFGAQRIEQRMPGA